MLETICATRRPLFHSHCCSCFPIHNASCAPFAPCLRGLGPSERGHSMFDLWVRSSTDFPGSFTQSFSEILMKHQSRLVVSRVTAWKHATWRFHFCTCNNLHEFTQLNCSLAASKSAVGSGPHAMRNGKRKLRLVKSQQTMLKDTQAIPLRRKNTGERHLPRVPPEPPAGA